MLLQPGQRTPLRRAQSPRSFFGDVLDGAVPLAELDPGERAEAVGAPGYALTLSEPLDAQERGWMDVANDADYWLRNAA